jgi:hypothetical protein
MQFEHGKPRFAHRHANWTARGLERWRRHLPGSWTVATTKSDSRLSVVIIHEGTQPDNYRGRDKRRITR